MQAILEKVQQNAAAGDKAGVLAALSANFLTNVNINDLYNLYTSSGDVAQPWQYIRYHLGGTGTMAGTGFYGYESYALCMSAIRITGSIYYRSSQ